MLLLQSIVRTDDAQQAGASSQLGWGEFFTKWVGWPLVPDTRTNAEETGPSHSQMKAMPAVGSVQQPYQQQNLYRRLPEVAAELRRTKEELHEATDALGKLRTEKNELERENDRLHDSINWLLKLSEHSESMHQEFQNSNLIEDLQMLEVENSSLRVTNNDLQSRITIILGELQRIRSENEYSQKHSSFAGETDNFRRDLHQIRRRIIIEKTAKALGKRHDQPKGRRESFHNWSKRVQYPGWQRMSAIGTRMIKQGNKVAHQATRTELQAAIIDIDSTWEGYSEEAEVLQEMLDIIIDAGELDKDEDEDDGDFWPLT
ncbi:hypothetical protein C0989_010142 [Termitomyces sp. Mn162]|nr:hypothetical protein C0989_010142 [Termitomyces sp. Mn162]